MTDKIKTDTAELPDHTIVLQTPLMQGSKKIDRITLRKPATGELRGLNLQEVLSLDVNALEKLIPRISSPTLTKADVALMDPADIVQVGTEITGFFVTTARKTEQYLDQ